MLYYPRTSLAVDLSNALQGKAAFSTIGKARRTVCCSKLSLPFKHNNCLGLDERDSGHKRVPEPPASTMA